MGSNRDIEKTISKIVLFMLLSGVVVTYGVFLYSLLV